MTHSINCWVHQQYCWVHLAYPIFGSPLDQAQWLKNFIWVLLGAPALLYCWCTQHIFKMPIIPLTIFSLNWHLFCIFCCVESLVFFIVVQFLSLVVVFASVEIGSSSLEEKILPVVVLFRWRYTFSGFSG